MILATDPKISTRNTSNTRCYPKIRGMLCRSNVRSDGGNSTYVCLHNFYHHSAKSALLDGILQETVKIKAQFKRTEDGN